MRLSLGVLMMLLCTAPSCRAPESRSDVPAIGGAIDTADIPSAAELDARHHCEKPSLSVRSLSRALRASACDLTRQAWSQLKDGGAAPLGVTPADTVAVECALLTRPFVASLQDTNATGANVTFALKSRTYSVVAAFAHNGAFSGFTRSEPLDCSHANRD